MLTRGQLLWRVAMLCIRGVFAFAQHSASLRFVPDVDRSPALRSMYAVIFRDTYTEQLACAQCGYVMHLIVLRECTRLTCPLGRNTGGDITILICNRLIHAPIVCLVHGLFGCRVVIVEYRWLSLPTTFPGLPYPVPCTTPLLPIEFSWYRGGTIIYRFRCPVRLTFSVVFYSSLQPPVLPQENIRFPGTNNLPWIIWCCCPLIADLRCPCCGFFVVLCLQVSLGLANHEYFFEQGLTTQVTSHSLNIYCSNLPTLPRNSFFIPLIQIVVMGNGEIALADVDVVLANIDLELAGVALLNHSDSDDSGVGGPAD